MTEKELNEQIRILTKDKERFLVRLENIGDKAVEVAGVLSKAGKEHDPTYTEVISAIGFIIACNIYKEPIHVQAREANKLVFAAEFWCKEIQRRGVTWEEQIGKN